MTAQRLSTRATVTSVAAGAVAFKVSGEIIGLIEATPEQERTFAALLFQDGAIRITVEPVDAPDPAAAPTIEQIKERLRDALPNYRKLGFEPNAKNVITDISAEVAKMIEEARR